MRKSISDVAECVVVGVRLLNEDGEVVARYCAFHPFPSLQT